MPHANRRTSSSPSHHSLIRRALTAFGAFGIPANSRPLAGALFPTRSLLAAVPENREAVRASSIDGTPSSAVLCRRYFFLLLCTASRLLTFISFRPCLTVRARVCSSGRMPVSARRHAAGVDGDFCKRKGPRAANGWVAEAHLDFQLDGEHQFDAAPLSKNSTVIGLKVEQIPRIWIFIHGKPWLDRWVCL